MSKGLNLFAVLLLAGSTLSIPAIGSALEVYSPNGGETWFNDDCSYELTWDTSGAGSNVIVCVWSHTMPPQWAIEPERVANDGSHWVVTAGENPYGPEMWYFKVMDELSSLEDESDSPFSIIVDDDGDDDCQ